MPSHEIQTKTGRPMFESMIEASAQITPRYGRCDVCYCELSQYEIKAVHVSNTKMKMCAECRLEWFDYISYEP